jgi:tetratricopeptide (TPR) repeat protein
VGRAEDLAEEEARARYQAGQVAYSGEHWQRAFDDFSAAFALVPRAELLYDMARCLEHLGEPDKAVDYYQRFLTDSPDTKERENIERTILRLRAQIAATLEAHPVSESVHRKPVTRRWWFWTSVVGGVVVVGVGVGLGLGLGLKPNPHLTLPPVPIQ